MNPQSKIVQLQPFGLHFLEEHSASHGFPNLDLHYLEADGYTALLINDSQLPLVEAAKSLTLTQTISEQREHPEDGDDHFSSKYTRSVTRDDTKRIDNDGARATTFAATTLLMTVTFTKARENPDEEDPENAPW